jgi:hypothetical protein
VKVVVSTCGFFAVVFLKFIFMNSFAWKFTSRDMAPSEPMVT